MKYDLELRDNKDNVLLIINWFTDPDDAKEIVKLLNKKEIYFKVVAVSEVREEL